MTPSNPIITLAFERRSNSSHIILVYLIIAFVPPTIIPQQDIHSFFISFIPNLPYPLINQAEFIGSSEMVTSSDSKKH